MKGTILLPQMSMPKFLLTSVGAGFGQKYLIVLLKGVWYLILWTVALLNTMDFLFVFDILESWGTK